MTIDHNSGRMLAAFTRENGEILRDTLEIIESDEGVMYRFEVPNTAEGTYVFEHIKNRSIIESSFIFTVRDEDQEWHIDADGNEIRTVKELQLYDMSIISNRGAYSNTDMEVVKRQYDEFKATKTDEELEKERIINIQIEQDEMQLNLISKK